MRSTHEVFEGEMMTVLKWIWARTISEDPDVERRTRELLLDTLGCAIGGLRVSEVGDLVRLLGTVDAGHISYPGLSQPLSASSFIVCFATAACWYEITEGLAEAHGRPGLHVIPAVLAYGLAQRRSLGDALNAILAGYEIGGRLGHVYRMRKGMYADGTWGSFGSAAAISRLCGHSVEEAMASINHAACHVPFSIYYPITKGSVARNLTVGHGSLAGALAALAGKSGFPGPVGSLVESAKIALNLEMALPTADMPVGRWIILDGYLKKYPATRHIHYGVVAGIRWHEEKKLPAGAIERVTLRVYGEAIAYCGNRAPTAQIAAQFSLTFGLAWALAYGDLGVNAYDMDALNDPEVRRIEAMIDVVEDEKLTAAEQRGCTLEIVAAGDSWSYTVANVPGDRKMPLSQSEIIEKFLTLTEPVIARDRAEALVDHVLFASLDTRLVLES